MPENQNESTEPKDAEGVESSVLLASLDAGCVYHEKRWSGDTHADLGGTIDEAATDDVMRCAAEMIRSLLTEKLDQKREALRVMKRDAKRRMMSGKHGWSDMTAKVAIKTAEAEIRDLRSLANANCPPISEP